MTYRFTKEEIATWPGGHKGCWECKNVLPFASFHKAKWGMFGLNTVCKSCRKPRSKVSYSAQDYKKKMYQRAKSRATKKGVYFTITLEDIKIPNTCPILGIALDTSSEDTDTSPSLDRIIPELGYTPGNVQVISNRANRIKNNATPSELMRVAVWSYENTTGVLLSEDMVAARFIVSMLHKLGGV